MNRIVSCLTRSCVVFLAMLAFDGRFASAETPHVIFVMADDMGWGQTG